MGGIDDHRDAGAHRLLEALQQHGADFIPGPLHGGIAEQFGADAVGGEHQRLFAGLTPQQRRQVAGQGGLATAGRPDQQVAAQG